MWETPPRWPRLGDPVIPDKRSAIRNPLPTKTEMMDYMPSLNRGIPAVPLRITFEIEAVIITGEPGIEKP